MQIWIYFSHPDTYQLLRKKFDHCLHTKEVKFKYIWELISHGLQRFSLGISVDKEENWVRFDDTFFFYLPLKIEDSWGIFL